MPAQVFVNPGDVVGCANGTCDRKFRATKRISLAQLAKAACPDCGSPLTVQVETAPGPAGKARSAGGRTESASPGDVVVCTSATCGQKFRATKAMSLGPASETRCPACGSPLAVHVQPDEQPASQPAAPSPQLSMAEPDAADDFMSFLDEELSSEGAGQRPLAELLRLEDAGHGSAESRSRKAQLLICQCLAADPNHCPNCSSTIQAGAACCLTCGLEFETGKILHTPAADDYRTRYAEGLLTKARTKMAEAEERAREAQAERDAELRGDVLVAHLLLRALLSG